MFVENRYVFSEREKGNKISVPFLFTFVDAFFTCCLNEVYVLYLLIPMLLRI